MVVVPFLNEVIMSIDINTVNRALLKLGVNAISSPDEESTRAETVRNIYNDCVDYLLSQYDFYFAQKQVSLAKLDTEPVFGYKNVYKLPTDFIRLVTIDKGVRYEFIGNTIHSDADNLSIKYVFKNYDPSTYSPLFKELLSVRLAFELSPYIKEDRMFTQQMYNEEIDKINNSANRESMQNDDEFLPEDSWVYSRRV